MDSNNPTTSSADASRGAINNAINALIAERRTTTDAARIASLNDAIDNLNGNLQDLNQAQGLALASTIDAASNQLQLVVSSSPRDISDQFIAQIKDEIAKLETAKGTQGNPRPPAAA